MRGFGDRSAREPRSLPSCRAAFDDRHPDPAPGTDRRRPENITRRRRTPFPDEDKLIAHLLVGPIAVGFSSIAEADAQPGAGRTAEDHQAEGAVRSPRSAMSCGRRSTSIGRCADPAQQRQCRSAGEAPHRLSTSRRATPAGSSAWSTICSPTSRPDRRAAGCNIGSSRRDIGAVLLDVIEQSSTFAAQCDIRLTLDMPRTPVFASTDGDRLFQVVANLISNAAKFSPRGVDRGSVAGGLARQDMHPRYGSGAGHSRRVPCPACSTGSASRRIPRA